MRLALHSKLDLNIEAHLLYRIKEQDEMDAKRPANRKLSTMSLLDGRSVKIGHSSAVNSFELKGAEVSACHRLCIQPILGRGIHKLYCNVYICWIKLNVILSKIT